MTPFEPIWRKLHTRATRTNDAVRMYSNFLGGSYTPTQTSVADALTGQALTTIDLPRIVELAWKDGVRVFIEHGPRNHLTSAISSILGDRPHLTVALDVPGRSSMIQAIEAVAALWTAGVPVRTDVFDVGRVEVKSRSGLMQFPLRKPPIALPPLSII